MSSNIIQELELIKKSKHFEFTGPNLGGGGSSFIPIDYFSFCLNNISVDGLWMEFGCWAGRTCKEFAKHHKIYTFDSFEGLPSDWAKSNSETMQNGSFTLRGKPPIDLLNNPNIECVIGLFEDTFGPFLAEHKEDVACLHLDADLYSSTKTVLDLLILNSRIVSGTIIMLDEIWGYENFADHELKALMESGLTYRYLAHTKEQACIVVL